MIQRRPLTVRVKEVLADVIETNVAQKPPGGGWRGSPNDDGTDFVPYCVIVPEQGRPQSGQPLAGYPTEWLLPYSVSSYGISWDQAEWAADLARDTLKNMIGEDLILETSRFYRVQQATPSSIGAVRRYDATDPPHWGQTDLITFWLSRGAPEF